MGHCTIQKKGSSVIAINTNKVAMVPSILNIIFFVAIMGRFYPVI